MTRTIDIAGNTGRPVRLEDFAFVESARNGEVGQGGFNVDSEAAAFDILSHKDVTVTESDASADIFQGFIGDKEVARGPYKVDADRQFDLDLVDLNTLLGDRIIHGGSANRPAETDIQRVTWLSTIPAAAMFDAFNIGGTGAKNMDATDYNGRSARDVLADCGEMAGKHFFAYYDPSTDDRKVFYDITTAANWTSDFAISTVETEVNDTTVFAARNLSRRMDAGRIYSGVHVKYNGGSVFVENLATAATYRRRDIALYDDRIKTAAKATTRGQQYLAASADEEEVITCEVDVPSELIAGGFLSGQRVSIKAPHLGIPSPVYRRLVHREVKPRGGSNPKDYTIVMELSNPKTVRWGSVGVPAPENANSFGGSSLPPTPTPPQSCVTVDDFEGRTDAGVWGTSSGGFGAWTETVTGAGSTASVAGGIGTWTLPITTGATVSNRLDDVAGPWATNPEWTMKARVRFNNDAPAGKATIIGFEVNDITTAGRESLFVFVSRSPSDAAEHYIAVGASGTYDSAFLGSLGAAGTWLQLWYAWDGTTLWAKVWPEGDTEPDWLINYTPPAADIPSPMRYFRADYNDGTWTGANSADVDSITWCDSANVPLCETFLLDSFDRVEAGPDWGTSDAGPVWTAGGGGAWDSDVDGSSGRWTAAPSDGGTNAQNLSAWPGGTAFELHARFKFTATLVDEVNISWVIQDAITPSIEAAVTVRMDAGEFQLTEDVTTEVAIFVPISTTWYEVRWQRNLNGGSRARIWESASSEPSGWDVETASLAAISDSVNFYHQITNNSSVTRTFEMDYIEYSLCGTSVIPTFGQEVQYEFVAIGDGVTTSYTTDHPYRPGTLRIFVDMLPEVNVIETNPSIGAFTITGAPFNTEEIYVSYQATGT